MARRSTRRSATICSVSFDVSPRCDWHCVTYVSQLSFTVPSFFLVFPGIGLGATLCGTKTITDRMLYVAAEALANYLTEDELALGKVFPNLSTIRDVSKKVAIAVINEAIRTGQASKLSKKELRDLDAFVQSKMYDPIYVPLIEKRTITI